MSEQLTDVQLRQIGRILHDWPTISAFYHKHAVGPKALPSCLVCGREPQQWPPAIQHMELPGVIVCHACRDAAMAARTGGEPSREG